MSLLEESMTKPLKIADLCEQKIIATAEFDWWLRVPK